MRVRGYICLFREREIFLQLNFPSISVRWLFLYFISRDYYISWVNQFWVNKYRTFFSEQLMNPCEPLSESMRSVSNAGACICINDWSRKSLWGMSTGVRPQCWLPINKACIRNKCKDPCLGVRAQCSVISHIPTCICEPGYIGDPFTNCNFQPFNWK